MPRIDALVDTHKGQTCIVVGSAPCALEELERARQHVPDAVVMAVNDAAAAVHADYLATLHHELVDKYREKSLTRNICCICPQQPVEGNGVAHWFTGCNTGATSAWAGVRMALAMGFDSVIMVGCPMNGGDGYLPQADWRDSMLMRQRFGHAGGEAQVEAYKAALKAEVEVGDFGKVKSMSGFTAELLGQPEWSAEHGVH